MSAANCGIDLDVRAGEIVAFLGPNGAGKTTLLRQVAGQPLPSPGSIRVAEIDLLREPLRARKFLSVIPLEGKPKRDLTTEGHLRSFALLKRVPSTRGKSEVDRLLGETGPGGQREELVRGLSGGLAAGCGSASPSRGGSTKHLLLDGPTTGVDPEARRAVWRLIDHLRRRGVSILLTTHYLEETEHRADRLVVIHEGRLVAQGTVEQILAGFVTLWFLLIGEGLRWRES